MAGQAGAHALAERTGADEGPKKEECAGLARNHGLVPGIQKTDAGFLSR